MTVLRTLFAAIIVLIAPGYLLICVLFRDRRPRDAEYLALVIGGSIAVTVICGLVLQLTPGGISATGLNWALAAAIGLLALAATTRAPKRLPGLFPGKREVGSTLSNIRTVGLPLILAGLLGAGALIIAHNGTVDAYDRSAFTQLWLIPDPRGAQVGVTSFEHGEKLYKLVVSARRKVLTRVVIRLQSGSTYERQIPVSRSQAEGEPIEASLYLGSSATPYRAVAWTPLAPKSR